VPPNYDRAMHFMPASARARWREAHSWPGGPDWNGPWDPDVASGRFSGRSTPWGRLWIPVIISLLVQVPASLVVWDRLARTLEFRPPGDLLISLGIALVGPVALLFARRFPGPVVAIVAIAASADLLRAGGADGPPYISFAFAIGSAIVRDARLWAWVTIAVSWVGTIVLSHFVGVPFQPWRIIGVTIGILLVVGAAEGVRTRRERIEQMRSTIARRRQSEVQAERVRIARELHDVLAHSLSQINVQAGVGLHLMDKQPEKAAAALASIKETSKTALDEVRSVLGILRAEGGADPSAPLVPEPDLSRLEGLAASVSAQGAEVVLENRLGEVSQPTQLAIYRIVQESLTNVVRHAHATRVWVDLNENDDSYLITIADNGTGPATASEHRGRGLLGMHERAELLGGSLTAGRRSSGGFEVVATIPKRETVQ